MDPNDLLLLEALTMSTDAVTAVAAVERILQSKRVNALREDPRFALGLKQVVEIAKAAEPRAGLQLIAVLYRAGASSRPVAKMVRVFAAPLLSSPLPPVELLESGEDRFYLAQAVVANWHDWSFAYAAHAIASEDTAEKARRVFAEGLAARTSLSGLISAVANELRSVQYATERPAESAARRLARVVAAIRPALVATPMAAGEELGGALETLFRSAQAAAEPEEGSAAGERAASECCGLVYDILRTQIEIVTDAAVYRSLEYAARWMSAKLWPHFVGTDLNASGVLRSLEQAIVLLARRGTTDAELLALMQFFVGSKDAAAKRAAKIAANRADIAPDVREWLSLYGQSRGGARLTSMDDAKDAGTDPPIAAALVAAWEVRHLNSLEAENSKLPGVRRLLASLEDVAQRRRLFLRLIPGDIVEYSAHSHELMGEERMGVRRVTVVTPMVEKVASNGTRSVVLRAIVKEQESGNE